MKMKLSQLLMQELYSKEPVCPNVPIFVDESAMYWVTDGGHYIWLQDHRGMNDYIDANHQPTIRMLTDKSTEGVGSIGVYWMNSDFGNPFHENDFIEAIRVININA